MPKLIISNNIHKLYVGKSVKLIDGGADYVISKIVMSTDPLQYFPPFIFVQYKTPNKMWEFKIKPTEGVYIYDE